MFSTVTGLHLIAPRKDERLQARDGLEERGGWALHIVGGGAEVDLNSGRGLGWAEGRARRSRKRHRSGAGLGAWTLVQAREGGAGSIGTHLQKHRICVGC